MDKLDRAFLGLLRQPGVARRIRRHGVVRFRRQLRQEARLVDYPLTGRDRFRVMGQCEDLMDEMVQRSRGGCRSFRYV